MLMLGGDVYSLDGGGFHSLGAYPSFTGGKISVKYLMIATVEHGKCVISSANGKSETSVCAVTKIC